MNKNRILIIVFGMLFLVFFGNKYFGSDNNRNFKDVLTTIDTAAVTKIVVLAKSNAYEPVSIKKVGNEWEVSNGKITDEAQKNGVKTMLSTLQSLVPKQLVANSKSKWAQYELEDSLGTKVQVFNGDELLADVVFGKFNFNQNTRTATSYVRLSSSEDVYAVEGFLAGSFNKEFNNFRDGTFLKVEPSYLTSIKYQYPGDSSFVLNYVSDSWQIDGIRADSASVQKYFNGFKNLRKNDFIDNEIPADKSADYSMTLMGNNMQDITINAYQMEELVLSSTLNPGAYFAKGNLDVFKKLFVDKKSLLNP